MSFPIKKFLWSLYVKQRRFFEPLAFFLYRQHFVKIDPRDWKNALRLDLSSFISLVNEYPYRQDKLHGILDCVLQKGKEGYFFADLKHCRDCDDFARIFSLYLLAHPEWIHISEYLVMDLKHVFKSAHFVTVAQKEDGKWHLFNYQMKGPFSTEKEALAGVYLYKTTAYRYSMNAFSYIRYRSWI